MTPEHVTHAAGNTVRALATGTMRLTSCPLCDTAAPGPCQARPPADHLARWLAAEAAGHITRADLISAISGLDVITAHALVTERPATTARTMCGTLTIAEIRDDPGTGSVGQPPSRVSGRSRPTTAQQVVAALTLPAPHATAPEPPSPLPVADLHHLPRDRSMLYGIGRVDASGRVAVRAIIEALGWRNGDKLEVSITSRAIFIRQSPAGLFSVPQRPCIVIPSTARRQCDIGTGDHVLLAAAPEYGVVIVHTLSALDDMIAAYHSRATMP